MKNKILFGTLMLALLTLLAGLVAAAPTITVATPGTGTGNAASGTANISVTLATFGANWNNSVVQFEISSNGTNYQDLGNDTSRSGCSSDNPLNCTQYAIALNTATLFDDNTYTIRITTYNDTTTGSAAAAKTVQSTSATHYIDNNDGTCSISGLTENQVHFNTDTTITVTGVNMSSATLFLGGNALTLTEGLTDSDKGNDIFTKSLKDVAPGVYTTNVVVGDEVETKSCNVGNVEISGDVNNGRLAALAGLGPNDVQGGLGTQSILGNGGLQGALSNPVVLLLIAGGVWFFFIKK